MRESRLAVLLIDDDIFTRDLFRLVFDHHQLPFAAAPSPEEAVAHLETLSPNVIVIDLVLQDTDGYQVLEDLRARTQAEKICFVATTAYYTDLTRVEVHERGFHGYLPKPYRVDSLVAALSEFRDQVN